MTQDLNDLLGAAVSQREAGLTDLATGAVAQRTRRLVRGRRARRHAYEAGGAGLVVAVLGAGVWWGVQPDPRLPVDEPTAGATSSSTPTPTSGATPSPTETSTPAPTATAGTTAITDAVLRSSGPGWVLSSWDVAGTATAVHLTSPDGVDHGLTVAEPWVSVDAWRARDTRALVHRSAQEGPLTYLWLDLRDGSLTPTGVPDGAAWLGTSASGEHLFHSDGDVVALSSQGTVSTVLSVRNGYPSQVSPSGTHVWTGLGVSAIPSTGEVAAFLPPAGTSVRTCWHAGWLSDQVVVLDCTDAEDQPSTWAWDWTTHTSTRLYEGLGLMSPWVAGELADGRDVVAAAREDSDGLFATLLVGADGAEPVPVDAVSTVVRSVDGDVVVLDVRDGESFAGSLVRYDARTGALTTLLSSAALDGAAPVSSVVGD